MTEINSRSNLTCQTLENGQNSGNCHLTQTNVTCFVLATRQTHGQDIIFKMKKTICEADISIAADVTDLGVVVENKLKFDKQVAECVKNANGILASIRRTIKFIKGLISPFSISCNMDLL